MTLIRTLVALTLLLTGTHAMAEQKIYTGFFSNVAVSGYDAVSYFTEEEPVKGKKEFSHEWNGATWRFSSDENRQAFIADPDKYAPQYGGHCAWAISEGDYVSADPKKYDIVDNKLYLNYNQKIQDRWRGDIPGFIQKGDEFWASEK